MDAPSLCAQRRKMRHAEPPTHERYLEVMHHGWHQCVFFSMVAFITELFLKEMRMRASAGIMQSRVGLVWGPFLPPKRDRDPLITPFAFHIHAKRHAGRGPTNIIETPMEKCYSNKWLMGHVQSVAVGERPFEQSLPGANDDMGNW